MGEKRKRKLKGVTEIKNQEAFYFDFIPSVF